MTDRVYLLDVPTGAPVRALARRSLRAAFPIPAPLLRALGRGEQSDGKMWSDWLAEWGWAWAVKPEFFVPSSPLLRMWIDWEQIVEGADFRALALGVVLRLRVDGKSLEWGAEPLAADLERVWQVISHVPQESLGEALALALLRADDSIFNFGSAAPSWAADVARVVAERRSLVDERSPAPIWLRDGYAMLGTDAFGMLRSLCNSFADCDDVWETFRQGRKIPVAFAMAYWWEAAACLTERHDYEGAEEAQRRVALHAGWLEELTGLVDPRWHHQQGRLYYYAGNHEAALAEYLREYKVSGDDLRVSAMLGREIANVLCDLVCLDAARVFAERSVATARSQGQNQELYKSLGRLAEIRVKLGELEQAKELLVESLGIQTKHSTDNRSPAQTLTYLGHVCLLSGQLAEAGEWYSRATDVDGGGSSLPYVAMGQIALAVAEGNQMLAEQLWARHRGELAGWSGHITHVLPAATFCLAAAHYIPEAREQLVTFARALIDKRYPIEAAYLLALLDDQDLHGPRRDVETMLSRWQKALASIPPSVRAQVGPLNGPTRMTETFRRKGWQDDPVVRAQCYPLTLVAPCGNGSSASRVAT